jgi:hypothetical protein
MATCQQIITSALRKIGVVNEGAPTPNPYDAQVALGVLQGWYFTAMAQGVFGRLTDVTVEDDYEADEFERILNISDGDVTITLPETIDDCGTTRAPVDLCPVVVVDPGVEPLNYVYDALVGDWVSLNGLALTDEAPLSSRGPDNFACVLAIAIAEERGQEIGGITAARAAAFVAALTHRNASQRRDVDYEFY